MMITVPLEVPPSSEGLVSEPPASLGGFSRVVLGWLGGLRRFAGGEAVGGAPFVFEAVLVEAVDGFEGAVDALAGLDRREELRELPSPYSSTR